MTQGPKFWINFRCIGSFLQSSQPEHRAVVFRRNTPLKRPPYFNISYTESKTKTYYGRVGTGRCMAAPTGMSTVPFACFKGTGNNYLEWLF